MRIALLSTPFVAVPPRAYGGTELVVGDLERELTRGGHAVTLFATGDSRATDVRWLYRSAAWPPDPRAELAHCRFAAREIADGSFDVVHAHCPMALHLVDDMRTPVVYTLHHSREEALSAIYRRHPEVRYVAISRRQAELEDVECAVVHHGLDPARYPPGDGAGGYAFCLGRLSWCKGPDLAVAAARAAGVEIVLAGCPHEADPGPPGWREEALLPALRARGVHWVGSAGQDTKAALLAGARALLVPIRWEEPFGLVLVEAMLTGCPVIGFARGSIPELVDEGVTGFVVDDIREMAARLRGLGRFDRDACRRRARERFSGARMARDYLDLYAAAARVRPRPARAARWTPPP